MFIEVETKFLVKSGIHLIIAKIDQKMILEANEIILMLTVSLLSDYLSNYSVYNY